MDLVSNLFNKKKDSVVSVEGEVEPGQEETADENAQAADDAGERC
jgi:hypothetical protein